MTKCHECSTPYVAHRDVKPENMICSHCGECPAAQCRDCCNHFTELDDDRCDECAERHARRVAREQRDAVEEARGDYMRDEGKDRRRTAW